MLMNDLTSNCNISSSVLFPETHATCVDIQKTCEKHIFSALSALNQ